MKNQDIAANAIEVGDVRDDEESQGEEVVNQHLHRVGTRYFCPQNLMQIRTDLYLIVQSHEEGGLMVGPANPHLSEIVHPNHALRI